MTVDRRMFLGAAAALPFPAARPAPRRAPVGGPLALTTVLAEARELVDDHVTGESPNYEAWVHGATALLARLDPVPADPFTGMTEREQDFLDTHGWTYRRVDAAPRDGALPAVITHQIHIPRNGTIPLHDHRGMFGAIVCAAGDVRIRSFDIVAGSTTTAEVTLQESVRTWLTPGRFSLLTPNRDNVHDFVAGPEGARILDLFVWRHAAARSHDLEWLDDPDEPSESRRYRARWS